jgi:hypothetical protein
MGIWISTSRPARCARVATWAALASPGRMAKVTGRSMASRALAVSRSRPKSSMMIATRPPDLVGDTGSGAVTRRKCARQIIVWRRKIRSSAASAAVSRRKSASRMRRRIESSSRKFSGGNAPCTVKRMRLSDRLNSTWARLMPLSSSVLSSSPRTSSKSVADGATGTTAGAVETGGAGGEGRRIWERTSRPTSRKTSRKRDAKRTLSWGRLAGRLGFLGLPDFLLLVFFSGGMRQVKPKRGEEDLPPGYKA